MGGNNNTPNHLGAFWTVLPDSVEFLPPPLQGDGASAGPPSGTLRLHFSATVAFQIFTNSAGTGDFQLVNFTPLLDWPSFMHSATWTLLLSTNPTNDPINPTLVSDPKTATWQEIFGRETRVTPQRPQDYAGRDNRVIRSFPRREVADFVQQLHGVGGQRSAPNEVRQIPTQPPALQTVFQGLTTSRLSATRVNNAIRPGLTPAPGNPATWAVSRTLRSSLSADDRQASDFVQIKKYYSRLAESSSVPVAAEDPKEPDFEFHQLAAVSLLQPLVARQLGLILDFVVDVPEAAAGDGEMQLRINVDYGNPNVGREDVYFRTAYHLDTQQFEIRSAAADLDDSLVDVNGRYLKLGDADHFYVENGVDLDGAALKASEVEHQVSSSLLEQSDLPALRTAGIGISRVDAAPKLAEIRHRDRIRFNNAFGRTEDKQVPLNASNRVQSPAFVNHAEDLIRGFRFDVWDESRGSWFSLHRRKGEFLVGLGSAPISIPVTDDDPDGPNNGEGFTSITPLRPRPATKTQPKPVKGEEEYYLSEAMMRWGGWSLSVPRVGAPITNKDATLARVGGLPDGKPDFPRPTTSAGLVVSHVDTAIGLPRLRFGRTYRFRARIVDTAGNSVPFDRYISPDEMGDLATGPVKFLRYDPVESPTLVLREPPGPGENVHELVVRSEDRNEFTNGISQRLVPPPPTSQWLAELHGGFEQSIDGTHTQATDQYNALLAGREGKTWAAPLAHPVPGAAHGEVFVPVQPGGDVVPVPWLPDPAARRALVANLPGGSAQWISFGTGDWPNVFPGRLILHKGRDLSGQGSYAQLVEGEANLDVTLHKADIRTVEISSALAKLGTHNRSGADDFGLFEWMLSEALRRDAESGGVNQATIETVYRAFVSGGFHSAMTPRQKVRLVHAVRTPLRPATFVPRTPDPEDGFWLIVRSLGKTTADGDGQLTYSPRSTGRIDIRAEWNLLTDTGPGGADPTVPHPRSAAVYSHEFDREAVPAGLDPDFGIHETPHRVQHELGDTGHHLVAYTPKTTTAFLKYFREVKTVLFGGNSAVDTMPIGSGPLSPAPLTVTSVASGKHFVEGVDFRVDYANGSLTRLRSPLVNLPAILGRVNVSFIAGVIDSDGPTKHIHAPATERPTPPKVHSVVPSFRWNRQVIQLPFTPKLVQSTRSGGGLRVWLERPWWSSGEDEHLAVLVMPAGVIVAPYDDSDSFVSQSGTDPINDGRNTLHYLHASHFSGNALPPANVALVETQRLVTAVPYKVEYHSGRDQWYADIVVNPSFGPVGYFPFVKLVLARFQPYALDSGLGLAKPIAPGVQVFDTQTLQLSAAVKPDFVQVAPQRDVFVSKSARTLSIRVTGDSYLRMQTEDDRIDNNLPKGRGPTDVVATLQQRDPSISDPVLAWSRVDVGLLPINDTRQTPYHKSLQADPPTDRTNFSWRGTITLPPLTPRPPEYRVLIEEFETHYSDDDGTAQVFGIGKADKLNGIGKVFGEEAQLPSGRRCVFQDMIPLDGL